MIVYLQKHSRTAQNGRSYEQRPYERGVSAPGKVEPLKQYSFGLTKNIIIVIAVVLLAITLILGIIFKNRVGASAKELLNERMLDIASSAAALIDGDEYEKLDESSVGSPEYRKIYDTLKVFLDNTDLRFIYCVSAVGNDKYIFTVDPAKENYAAQFGQLVKFTDSLHNVFLKGKASVDRDSYEDEWGRFYSAYSPILNSEGEVVGAVAVDFDAEWYDAKSVSGVWAIFAISAVSLVVGAVIAVLVTIKFKNRFDYLYNEVISISDEIESLSKSVPEEYYTSPDVPKKLTEAAKSDMTDKLGGIGHKLISMQSKLHTYIDYVSKQAFIDRMTGAKNKSAYIEKVKELDVEVARKTGNFAVVVFDINGLKVTNDNYGHEYGDRVINDSFRIMRRVFGKENLYRIGGDEFIALLKDVDREELDRLFARADEAMKSFNENEKDYDIPVTFSKGGAVYDPEKDTEYKQIFKRADDRMYEDKAKHYAALGGKFKIRDNPDSDEID